MFLVLETTNVHGIAWRQRAILFNVVLVLNEHANPVANQITLLLRKFLLVIASAKSKEARGVGVLVCAHNYVLYMNVVIGAINMEMLCMGGSHWHGST